jgi:hypothetical protein
MSLCQVGENMREISCACWMVAPSFEQPHRPQPVCAAVLHPFIGKQPRRVNSVVQVERITETGRHNADDRRYAAIQFHCLIQDIAVAVEILLPRVIAQDNDVVLAVFLLAGQKRAPQQRLHAEYLKEVVCR